MTSNQTSNLNSSYVSFDLHLFYPHKKKQEKEKEKEQKVSLRDHNGNKATQFYCVVPAIAPRIFFNFSFYITVPFLNVNLFGKVM